jgi:hypothetical protein
MAWTTPKTDWAESNLVTETHLNDIGSNLAELKAPPSANYELDETSDYTTTSSSFVDIDDEELSLTIDTTGGDIMVGFIGSFNSSGDNHNFLELDLDGSAVAGDDGICKWRDRNEKTGFVYLITGVSATSHIIKLQWKRDAGTLTLYAGAGTSDADVHPQFWAREVS